jgi:hypothetical protein
MRHNSLHRCLYRLRTKPCNQASATKVPYVEKAEKSVESLAARRSQVGSELVISIQKSQVGSELVISIQKRDSSMINYLLSFTWLSLPATLTSLPMRVSIDVSVISLRYCGARGNRMTNHFLMRIRSNSVAGSVAGSARFRR